MILSVAVVASLAGGEAGSDATATAVSFAAVETRDLIAVESLDGSVTTTEGQPVINRRQGTFTAGAGEGSTVGRGEVLYTVDDQPVVLLYGVVPGWRPIGDRGQEAVDGTDVKQLEENLAALGYSTGTVDEQFTASTESAIEAWQETIGAEVDSVVDLGEVVFLPGPVTILEQKPTLGAAVRDGDIVHATQTDEKIVTIPLAEGQQTVLSVGQEVMIELPDRTRVAAKVTSIDSITPTGSDQASLKATVVPDDRAVLTAVRDGSSVDVEIVTDRRENVLTVPVTALVARTGGGYVVEVDRGPTREFVEVEAGLFADDHVEVRGELQEGDRVVVP